MEIFKLLGRVTLDGKSAIKGLDGIEIKTKGLGSSLTKLGSIATGVLAGSVAAGIGVAIKKASDLQETQGKFDTVFQGNTIAAEKFAEEIRTGFNVSELQAKGFLSSIQDILVPMGVARDEATSLSAETVKLAADLASFNNVPVEETLRAIQGGLTGVTVPLKRFGVVINQAQVEQEAYNLGLIKQGEELTNAAKAQATLSLITKNSSDAIGDVARTSGSFANQLKETNARVEDTITNLGKEFLPIANELLIAFNDNIVPVIISFTDELIKADSIGKFIVKTFQFIIMAGQGVVAIFDLAGQGIASFALAITGNLKAAKLGFEELGVKIQEQAQKFKDIGDIQIQKNTEIETNKREQQTLTTQNKLENDQLEIQSDDEKTENKVENDTEIADSQTELENSVTNSQNRLASNFTDSIMGVEGAWQRFGDNVVNNILKNLIKETLKAIGVTKVLKGLLGGATGGGLGFVGSILGFENGVSNFVVPSGFPNDSFPIGVTSGETVNVTPAGKSPGVSSVTNISVSVPPVTSRQAAREYGDLVGNAILSKVEQNRKINR